MTDKNDFSMRAFRREYDLGQKHSVYLKTYDSVGEVSVETDSMSTGKLKREYLLRAIIKYYYDRSAGISKDEFDEAVKMFDDTTNESLILQRVKHGNLKLSFMKDERRVESGDMPKFSTVQRWSVYFWESPNDFNDAIARVKEAVFEEANERKQKLKAVIETVEKLAQDAGISFFTTTLNPFERSMLLEVPAGEDDAEVIEDIIERSEGGRTDEQTDAPLNELLEEKTKQQNWLSRIWSKLKK